MTTETVEAEASQTWQLSRRAKEAIKVSLALVIAYYVALYFSWMKPYWVCFAIAMINLPSKGESIRKGLYRIAGTIPACISALVIFAIAPQERWLFIFLACCWIGLTGFLFLQDKKHAYIWQVAGFVCFVILLTGSAGSDHIFYAAMYRTLETITGVAIYTLVMVFIWPQSHSGTTKQLYVDLIDHQQQFFQSAIHPSNDNATDSLALYDQQVTLLTELEHSIDIETVEDVNVFSNRHLLHRLHKLSSKLTNAIDRLSVAVEKLHHDDLDQVLPSFDAQSKAIIQQFESLKSVSDSPIQSCNTAEKIQINLQQFKQLDHSERAAVLLLRTDMAEVQQLLNDIIEHINLLLIPASDQQHKPEEPRAPFIEFVPDIDTLKMVFAVMCYVFISFCFWIYFDPPGHMGWIQMAGSIGLVMASMPQLRVTLAAIVVMIAFIPPMLINVFVMPSMSMFAEIAALIFVYSFLLSYFLSYILRILSFIGMFQMLNIQNLQAYNFAATLNAYLYLVLVLLFLFGLSYAHSASRPEKILPSILKRFYRSATWLLVERFTDATRSSRTQSLLSWFHRYEVESLPNKMIPWAQAIDHKLFTRTTNEQLQQLIRLLQSQSRRMQQLTDYIDCSDLNSFNQAMRDELGHWQQQLADDYQQLRSGNYQICIDDKRVEAIHARVDDLCNKYGQSVLEREWECFFQLFGCYLNLTKTNRQVITQLNQIDWQELAEERFS